MFSFFQSQWLSVIVLVMYGGRSAVWIRI